MTDQEIIIKFLLEEVSKLTVENKKLNDLVKQLQADCYYYENYWRPKEKQWRKKKEDKSDLF